MKTIVAGWFIIKAMLSSQDSFIYELVEPQRNYYITLESPHKLPYGPDHWIKLQMHALCEDSIDSDSIEGQSFMKSVHFCTSDNFLELKCTERNSFVINGIRFC